MAVLAELVIHHSRPIAPTRRVALGECDLPTDPLPGYGGVLIGAVVATFALDLDEDLVDELDRLTRELDAGLRIPQPRLRHRLQVDRIGLTRSHSRLVRHEEAVTLDHDGTASPAQRVLGAVYAAGAMDPSPRHASLAAVRKAIQWGGPIGPTLFTHLSGANGSGTWSSNGYRDPVGWALGVLDLADGPDRRAVQRRFRELVRAVHPDHGAAVDGAAERIADLSEARRILLRA